jgi:hypothetical protein
MKEELFCIISKVNSDDISIKIKGDFNDLSRKLAYCMAYNEVVRDIIFDAMKEFLDKKMEQDFKINPN